MWFGIATNQSKQYCIVNKKGYISLYALLIFMITMSFVTLCTLQLTTLAYLKRSEDLHAIEILAIHHSYNILQTQQNKQKKADEKRDEVVTETLLYNQIPLHYEYQKEHIIVRYEYLNHMYTIYISFDNQNDIMDIVYS